MNIKQNRFYTLKDIHLWLMPLLLYRKGYNLSWKRAKREKDGNEENFLSRISIQMMV